MSGHCFQQTSRYLLSLVFLFWLLAGDIPAQTAGDCKYSLAPASQSHGAGTDTGTISVTAPAGCKWTAAANVSWITITSDPIGSGDGTVTYSVAANTGSAQRNGSIFIGGQTFAVTQATPCPFTLAPSNRSHGPGAETSTITVKVPDGCGWTATSNVSWVTIVSANVGSGDGTVTYTVAANPVNTSRNGAILIGGQTFAITQANRCPFTLTPATRTHGSGTETGTVVVSGPESCSWTAKSNAPWITLTSDTSGSGNGSITYSVAANVTPTKRTGTVTIGGATFTINQPTSCFYSIDPFFRVHKAVMERGDIKITAPAACTWTAVSDAGWISILAGKKGTGPGVVTYLLEPNNGNRFREGTITIVEQKFTVYQAGIGCPYNYEPGGRSHGPGTEAANFKIVMAGACKYNVATNANWIILTGTTTFSGSSAIAYRLAANTTPQERSGGISLDFAQGEFAVAQATPCPNFSIDPAARKIGTGAEKAIVNVMNASGCTWTASTTAPWITITSGKTGRGDGAVGYSVAANRGPAERKGTISIDGKALEITQPTSCPFSFSPPNRSHGAGTETGSVFVSVPEGCSWTASSAAPWIIINSGRSGNGDGVLKYTLQPNTGSVPRTGSITFPGTSFAITQEPACPYTITPTTRAHNPAAEKGEVFVTAPGSCPWTAKSGVNWITITGGATGKDSGMVAYALLPNTTSAPRSGSITIAGQVFTVTQSSGGADLSLSKRHTGNLTAGSSATYLLTVDNIGSVTVNGTITVTDILPAGMNFVSATGNGWSCSASGQTVTCTNPGPLKTGDSSTITLNVNIEESAPPRIINTATVSHSIDTNALNNVASDAGDVIALTRYAFRDRGGMSSTILGASDAPTIGYARVLPDDGQTTPSGLAIFGLRQNGILVTEAGVPTSPLVHSARIYAEVNGPVNTGVAIANPNNQDATVDFYFTDAQGVDFGAGSFSIPANGQIAAFLNQSPFNGGAVISGTFTFSSSVPVSAIALRGFTNERSEFLITTLPVVDLSGSASGVAVFPHFADGGGWTTQLVLLNPTDQPMGGTVQFLGQGDATAAAQPLSVNIDGETKSAFAYTLAPRSSQRLKTSGSSGSINAGSIRVIPSGGSRTPSGLGIFTFKSGNVTVTEAGVPLLGSGSAFRMYAQASQEGSIRTGVAIANLSSASATVNFELTTLTGTPLGMAGSVVIPGDGQMATFLEQIPGFSSLPTPFQGVLRFSATSPISVVGLRGRVNERGDFLITTTSPVNEEVPAASLPVFLPHFADGGGYTAQFILFSGSAGQSSTGRIEFYGQAGQVLNLSLK